MIVPIPRSRTAPRAGESELGRVRRARRMARLLTKIHPDAHCELDYASPLQLAVATILSAQCTDRRVNETTPKLFARYPTAADYAQADRAELEEMIRPTGFFRNKAGMLIRLGQMLEEKHDGEIPRHLDELTALPGIGRKSANVILSNAFGVPAISVDTHFSRLARRWDWTRQSEPGRIEKEVCQLFERRDWIMVSHQVVFHGRRVCHARTPACGACALARDCPSYGTGPIEPAAAAKLVKGPRAAEIVAFALQAA